MKGSKKKNLWIKQYEKAERQTKKDILYTLERYFKESRRPMRILQLSNLVKYSSVQYGLNPSILIMELVDEGSLLTSFRSRFQIEYICRTEDWDSLEDIEQKKFLSQINGRLANFKADIRKKKAKILENLAKKGQNLHTESIIRQSANFFKGKKDDEKAEISD